MARVIRGLLFLSAIMLCSALAWGSDTVPATTAGGGTGPVTMLDAIAFIREFGFQTFITLFLLLRLEKRLDRFTESIEKLQMTVALMAKTVESK